MAVVMEKDGDLDDQSLSLLVPSSGSRLSGPQSLSGRVDFLLPYDPSPSRYTLSVHLYRLSNMHAVQWVLFVTSG